MYNGRKFSEVSISDKRNIHKLKLTNYNVIIKIGKQDLIDIKKIIKEYLSHTIYQQKKLCKKKQFNNFLMGINKNYFLIEFCFEIIILSEGNTCIA